MKHTTNANVVAAWLNDESAKSNNMTTYDGTLYSFRMLIGVTADDGTKYLLNARGKASYSTTTSKHITLAARSGKCTLVEPVVTHDWRYFPKNTHPGMVLGDYGIFYTVEQYQIMHSGYVHVI